MSLQVLKCRYENCTKEIPFVYRGGQVPKYCLEHRVVSRRIQNRNNMRKKMRLKTERICLRCNGKISKAYKSRYCTNYCYWLNLMKNRHYQRVIRSLQAV